MKARRGMIVKITFSDHGEGGGSCFKFTVVGKLASITRSTLAVDSWYYTSTKMRYESVNCTRFTIVRSAIHRIVRLKEDEVIYDEKDQA